MLGRNAKWIVGVIGLLIVALVFVFWPDKVATTADTATHDLIKQPGNSFDRGEAREEAASGPISKKARVEPSAASPVRSKGTLLKEVRRVFSQAEAARTRKLEERFSDGNGIYLYVVEQPSNGEVQTVKAQIADLWKEVAPADQEDFNKRLEEEIASYDPYGEKDRKVFVIMASADEGMPMSGLIVEAGDLEEFRKNFVSGESHTMRMRQGWFASGDGETLDRFDQILVWDPEKPE